jgi:hypothetical protein
MDSRFSGGVQIAVKKVAKIVAKERDLFYNMAASGKSLNAARKNHLK